MAVAPSAYEMRSVMRSLLRVARRFPDYNIREYIKRRTIEGFGHNQKLTDAEAIATAFIDAKSQLEIANRQAVIYSLYAPKIKSIMEVAP